MTGAVRRLLTAGVALALAAGAVGFALRSRVSQSPAIQAAKPPKLLLLTSLPLIFAEDFTLTRAGSPALKALRSSFEVVPISVADGAELRKGGLLLMAQPFAQTAENLVVLDEWVRRGGRVLLLADPLLEWPSNRPLGDLTRPPPMFTDTGLLAHWGLRLDAPDERGFADRKLGSYQITTLSPGRLSGRCELAGDGFEARCRIGRGIVMVIADADFLNTAGLGARGSHNLDALLEQLAKLRQP